MAEDGFEGYVRDVQGPASIPRLERRYSVTHDIQHTRVLVDEHGLTSIHRVSDELFDLMSRL